MISTMDVISGGRMELGIGAGWKRDEWLAYGYGFPETRERLARLADDLEVINRMLAGDKHQHATFDGSTERHGRASTCPSRSSSRGSRSWSAATGPNVTWRLAAKHADELNLDGMDPDEVAAALPTHPRAVRGDRPRPGDARDLGPHVVGPHQGHRAAARRPAGRVSASSASAA